MDKINLRNVYIELLNKIKNVEGVDKDYVDDLIDVVDQHLTALDTDLSAITNVIPESASITNPLVTEDDIPAQVNSDWNASSGVAQILNKPTIIIPVYMEFTVNSWTLVSGTYRAGFQIQGVLNYTLPHFLFIRPLSSTNETAAEQAAFALITKSTLEGDVTPPVNSVLTLYADTEPTTAFKIGVIAWETE